MIMGNNPVAKTDGRKSGPSTRGGRGGSRAVSSAEQKIKRHLGVSGEASLAKRISELPRKKFSNMANRKVFKIVGLQQSKAASNADRGERGLLDFIERKSANMGRGLKIIKVCIRNCDVRNTYMEFSFFGQWPSSRICQLTSVNTPPSHPSSPSGAAFLLLRFPTN